MWNKLIVYSMLLLLPVYAQAQKKIYLEIQKNKYAYDKDFFFSKITDNRKVTDNIGIAYNSNRVGERFADLPEPLPKSFFSFLKEVYPNTSAPNQLMMVVNEFQIGHVLSKHDTGFVILDADFYKLRHDSSIFICHYAKRLAETTDDITLSHPNRMKRAILASVAYMETQLSNPQPGQHPGLTMQAPATNTTTAAANYSQKTQNKEDSITRKNNYPAPHYIMVGGFVSLCTSSYQFGVNLSYLTRLKKHPRCLLGPALNYSVIKFHDDVSLPTNTSYKLFTSDFGARLLWQVKNIVFLNCNAHMLIGKETFNTLSYNSYMLITNSEKSQLFTGFQVDAGVLLTQPHDSGIYFGTDLVIRITSSDVYDTDVGIKFSLGAKF